MPVLHLFSNVLDIQTFCLDGLAEIVSGCINSYAQFVCVGPYFGHSGKDSRMEEFAELLDGTTSFAKSFESGEFEHGKSWTAQILCFSVGMLEENFSTEVTEEDLKNGVADEFGVVYSRDGKRLLECKNSELETYTIKEGTKVVCDRAFLDCSSLQSLTLPDSVTSIGDSAFLGCSSLQSLTLPTSVTSIGNWAFWGCSSLQSLTLPTSVTSIGIWAFNGCKSLHSLTLPDSVTSIGDYAFYRCESLCYIIIPENSVERFKEMLPDDLWGKLYYLEKAFEDDDSLS
ncbi:MAG: leucine-rich repeat domain-containing protein [Paludibacteraceae bacterium]|nr:leucine-rich repeat domain-containing protein [Paludibacteraceae bacterium]